MTDLPVIKTLKNGLRVVYTPFKGVDSVNFRLIGRAGGTWETSDILGAAHFVEHLVFNGTEKYNSPQKLNALIENVGGSINGNTGIFRVCYIVKLLKEEMDKGFDFLSQLSLYPLLKQPDVEKERTIIIQEYTNQLDDPVSNFIINSQKYIYPKKHRFSEPLIGNFETLKKISRKQLIDYYKRNYTASNFVLSVCGDGIQDKVFNLAEKYFGSMKKGSENEYIGYRNNKNLVTYIENNDRIKQSTLGLIFPANKKYNSGYFATKYLQLILGGAFTSRLFDEIRQKRGLAYSVGSRYYPTKTYGLFNNTAQVDPNNVIKVIKLMNKEFQKIYEKGVTAIEFNRTRKRLLSNFIFSNENPGAKILQTWIISTRRIRK